MNRLIIEYQNYFNEKEANKENIIQKLNDCSIAGLTSFIIYLKNKYKIVDVLISNGRIEFISLLKNKLKLLSYRLHGEKVGII